MDAGTSQSGFTLVELALVLILLSILGAVVIPRLADTQVFSQRGFTDKFADALRYARSVALASECPVQVSTSANGYKLSQLTSCDSGAAIPVLDPGSNEPFSGSAPKGVTLSATTIRFNSQGSIGNTQTISITGNGGQTTITIYGQTGYVQSSQ